MAGGWGGGEGAAARAPAMPSRVMNHEPLKIDDHKEGIRKS